MPSAPTPTPTPTTAPAHVAKALDNLRVFDVLIEHAEIPPAWAITVLFYAAAHYGRAVCVAAGHGPFTSHLGFETDLSRVNVPRNQYMAYRFLKDESERARYGFEAFTKDEVQKARNQKYCYFETWCKAHGARLSDE